MMGVRIAKLESDYSFGTWIVYQSVNDSCFRPMFFQELAAQLFAHHYGNLRDLKHADWSSEIKIADSIVTFLRALFGQEMESNDDYFQVLEACNGHKGHYITRDLWLVWQTWRKDQSLTPQFVLPSED
jgi:hypothetical protein